MKDTIIIEPTFDSLNELKYTDLKEKFAELGVESVWRAGVNKANLINLALEKLVELRKIRETAIEAALVEAEKKDQEKEEAKRIEEENKQLLLDAQEEERLEKQSLDKPKKEIKVVPKKVLQAIKPKYSKAVIEENLRTITSNLLNGVIPQREILLNKQKELNKMLEYYK